MSGSTDGEPAGPGLFPVIASMAVSFTVVTVAALYIGDLNSTQAVLVGGAAAIVSAIVAVRTAKKANAS